jgi:hypothetical protein
MGLKPPREEAPRLEIKLDSRLYKLVQAKDRYRYAEDNGLFMSGDKVLVVIEMAPDCTEADIREYRNITVKTSYRNHIEALVPVDDLAALAKEKNVTRIRPPYRLKPLK